MGRIEITPDQLGNFEIYGREYSVCAATDCIQRFVDPCYDYLRYLDPEEHAITLHWLGTSALSTLAGFGVPETRKRLKIQQCEYDEYLNWNERMGMWVFEKDLAELPDTDDIDRFFGNN